MRRKAGFWLLVIGLIVGPGSLLAGRFFSGYVVADAPLTFTAGADGSPQARFAFSLTDGELPAAVIVEASVRHGPALLAADPPVDRWTLRLMKDGSTLREQTMLLQSTLVESSPTLVFKEAVPLDAGDGGGDYVLEVVPQGAPRLALDAARAEVRAGVESVDRSWLAVGIALMAAGVALILFA